MWKNIYRIKRFAELIGSDLHEVRQVDGGYVGEKLKKKLQKTKKSLGTRAKVLFNRPGTFFKRTIQEVAQNPPAMIGAAVPVPGMTSAGYFVSDQLRKNPTYRQVTDFMGHHASNNIPVKYVSRGMNKVARYRRYII